VTTGPGGPPAHGEPGPEPKLEPEPEPEPEPGPTGGSAPGSAGSPIRANTVLPARRTPMTLHTEDGVDLVAELALPVDRAPVASIVCLHPLPTAGGMMDSHVLRKAAWRLPALAGVAVLRFNTRGTASTAGTSGGTFDDGVAEGLDVAAAVTAARAAGLPDSWLLGWSFGTELALVHGLLAGVAGAVLLSPPLRPPARAALPAWAADGRALTALVPEFDDQLRPDAAREAFGVVPQAVVVGVAGARHLWVGHAERVLDEVVARVVPGHRGPLPRVFDGPVTTGDASAYADRTVAALAARAADASTGAAAPSSPDGHRPPRG